MALTGQMADQVADLSLAQFVPQATYLTSTRFCSHCPRNTGTCFPCPTARTMISVYLMAVVARKSKLN